MILTEVSPETFNHPFRVLWWRFLHLMCFLWMLPCYGYRAFGVNDIPKHGPVLFVSNHQSFLDPILVGLGGYRRRFFAMARSTLFTHPVVGWIIRTLNSFPVERGGSDMSAMRRGIDVLQHGQLLLLFAEGSRTQTGQTNPFASGSMLLIKRAKPVVVPVAIEGAFAAWPRQRKLPRATGRIYVHYGKPVEAEVLLAMGNAQALEYLRQQVETMRLELAAKIARIEGRPHP